MKTVFSGIAPSGEIHIGNYLGAITQWVSEQKKNKCIFCVVDYHAITVPQPPEKLREKIAEVAKIYLAAGIDPERSTIFVQSEVSEHAELAWVLGTLVKMSELELMTQFKDKAARFKGSVGAGLFNYPVLMAADILLYDTEIVPVGEDQKQHVELSRALARRFNDRYGETFKIPEALIRKEGKRIMGLDDPEKKMSKSAANPANYIALRDKPDIIRNKIRRAVTDSGNEIGFDEKNKKGISNLITIYSAISGKTVKEIEKIYSGKGYGDFKSDLAEITIQSLAPFQDEMKRLDKDSGYVRRVLNDGAEKARAVASKKMKEVKEKIGFLV